MGWKFYTASGQLRVKEYGSPIPAGTIFEYGGVMPSAANAEAQAVLAPAGYLFVNGAAFTTSLYPSLYAVLGTTFGTNGAGTFRLPNKIDRFTVGAGNLYLRGTALGSATHTHTANRHYHYMQHYHYMDHTHGMDHTHYYGHSHTFSGGTAAGTSGVAVQSTGAGTQWGALAYQGHSHSFSGTTDIQGNIGGNSGSNYVWSVAQTHGGSSTNTASNPNTGFVTTAPYTGYDGYTALASVAGNANDGDARGMTTSSNLPPYLAMNYIIKY